MELVIRGAEVYSGRGLCQTDVLVSGGRITAVGTGLRVKGAEVVEAEGCLLAPGFTDLHVHLREPGFEAKETIASGTRAAAAGGFTTVCAMPNLRPVPDSAAALAPQLEAIRSGAVVEVLPYAAITAGQRGETLADIEALAPLVAGFSDDGRGVQSEAMMRAAMRRVAAAGSFVAAHCEAEALLPGEGVCIQPGSPLARENGWKGHSNESEWAEVRRDIALSAETGCRLHICHASAAESFALVRDAKARGLPVSCEATPHNLLLSCEDIADEGRYKMNPPLRRPEDRAAAVAALLDGTCDSVATDHAPHTGAEKAGGFAGALNGVVGLETAFAALYTRLVLPGKLPLERLLYLLTEGPRRVLQRAPGRIEPGAVADLVLLDLQTEREVCPDDFATKGRASPFEGWRLKGWPVLTLCGGREVWRRR